MGAFVRSGVSENLDNSVFNPLEIITEIDLNFGEVIFVHSHKSAKVKMDLNGLVQYSDGLDGYSLGTPAQLFITGEQGQIVDIACADETQLSENVLLTNIIFHFGTTSEISTKRITKCEGLGSVVQQVVLSENTSENILVVSGELQINDLSKLESDLLRSLAQGISFYLSYP